MTWTRHDLIAWRERMGWTQEVAAHALETPLATYGSWERGRRSFHPVVAVTCRLLEERTTADLVQDQAMPLQR